jgi:addiction module RelE/StbE family toxin
MAVVFDRRALADIEAIFDWIAKDSPSIARSVVERLLSSIDVLAEYPEIGRAGSEAGTREWIVPKLPYIVVYEVDPDSDVVIVAVFHGAQERPLNNP